ncbi:MAG: hypothetical protein JWR34_1176 [Mycobacterium sp.]|jgi:hypothetical protein|nr:hypothetical protein [Mycobacterium sp.]
MGISAYLPAPMAPVLPLVITVAVIVAGRLMARRASAEVDGHRMSTGPQRFLDAAPVDVVDPIHSVGGLGERFDAAVN